MRAEVVDGKAIAAQTRVAVAKEAATRNNARGALQLVSVTVATLLKTLCSQRECTWATTGMPMPGQIIKTPT